MKVEATAIITKPIDIKINKISLFTIEEYKKYYKKDIPLIDEWWWLQSPGYGNKVAFVHMDGSLNAHGCAFYHRYSAVRPILKGFFDLNYTKFRFGGFDWTILDEEIAICSSYLKISRFDKESNNYENSEIKTYLENWLKENLK